MKSAVFLDRDGTLVEEKGYLHHSEELRLLPGAARGVRLLREAGFSPILVTNQSAVARGLITERQLEEINNRLQQLLHQEKAWIDAIYYCPHHPEEGSGPYRKFCFCRKPEPGMLLQAAREQNLLLGSSFMIGDKLTDVVAGQRAGCRTVLVRTGYGERELARLSQARVTPDFILEDLEKAAQFICEVFRF